MILDKGIATLSHKTNTAAPGGKPAWTATAYYQSWYGELNFETSPAYPTDRREEVRTDARIRVLQNRGITELDLCTLQPVNGAARPYRVRRAYHGRDDESGELITDLSLEVITP